MTTIAELDTIAPYADLQSLRRSGAVVLACYTQLSLARQHLLDPLLHGAAPTQWAHYPIDDVVDSATGFQYFYHSHSPEDRPDSSEHGHFHLFARLDGELHGIDESIEFMFLDELQVSAPKQAKTANLMCISLDAKGVPIALFTVNRWVTGGHLLSARTTLGLLSHFRVGTPGFGNVNSWLQSMIGLYWPQIVDLMMRRDLQLAAYVTSGKYRDVVLEDRDIELLSSIDVDIDARLAELG